MSLGTFLPSGALLVLTCLALMPRVPPTRAARLGLAVRGVVQRAMELTASAWVIATAWGASGTAHGNGGVAA